MKKPLIISALFAVLACRATLADEQKKVVAKGETSNGNVTTSAYAEARASSTSTTTTIVDGKPVTVLEDQDDNGKKRLRMITYQGGKPKVKDITPKEKPQKEDPLAKQKTAENAKPVGGAK